MLLVQCVFPPDVFEPGNISPSIVKTQCLFTPVVVMLDKFTRIYFFFGERGDGGGVPMPIFNRFTKVI